MLTRLALFGLLRLLHRSWSLRPHLDEPGATSLPTPSFTLADMVRFKVSLDQVHSAEMSSPLIHVAQNRWLLVELLFPSSQTVPSALAFAAAPAAAAMAAFTTGPDAAPDRKGKRRAAPPPPSSKAKRPKSASAPRPNAAGPSSSSSSENEAGSEEGEDEEDRLSWPHPSLSPLPLLLPPPPNPSSGKLKRLDEKAIFHALKASVVQAFGDDGWGRVGANTSG